MKTYTQNYLTAITSDSRRMTSYLERKSDSTRVRATDDLISWKISEEAGLTRAVMKQAEAKWYGSHYQIGDWVRFVYGVYTSSSSVSYQYTSYFKVVELEEDQASGITTAKLYDPMYEALQPYAIGDSITYPVTLRGLLVAICTELGWTLDSSGNNFPNSSISITSNVFANSDVSYRDVLNQIAEAGACILCFPRTDGKLYVRSASSSSQLTLDPSTQNKLTLEEEYKELNSVVLSRQPQEDNIVMKDDSSIAQYGLHEYKISNNLILDTDRTTYITPIYNKLHGLTYYPAEVDTVGLGIFEVGDRVTVTDMSGSTYEIVVMDIQLSMGGGLKEKLTSTIPDKTATNYDYAGVIGENIKNTQIIVNKQEGEINLINQEIESMPNIVIQASAPENPEVDDLWLNTTDNVIYIWDGNSWVATSMTPDDLSNYYTKSETDTALIILQNSIESQVTQTNTNVTALGSTVESLSTSFTQTSTSLQAQIDNVGGTNLLKNSVGLKGSLYEWQVLDENGDPVDPNNTATISTDSTVVENSESHCGFRFAPEQYIVQTIQTIDDAEYTLYMKFRKSANCNLKVTIGQTEYTVAPEGYTDDEWAVYTLTFTAPNTTTDIKIGIDNTVNTYAYVTDICCKIGTVCTAWTQAPNEAYGQNFRFDADGLTITDTNNSFKSVLDEEKLGIYDTSSNKTMALFSKDYGQITELEVNDKLTIKEYGSSTTAVVFTKVSDGIMVSVND